MGDHRLNVDISVMGLGGRIKKVEMWLNWHERRPEEIYRAVVQMAIEAELPVDDKSYLFEDGEL